MGIINSMAAWAIKDIIRLRGEADAASCAVFLEDTTEDDTLVDARLLDTCLGDIAGAVNALLENTEVELPLTAEIVLDRLGHGLQSAVSGREEHLGGAKGALRLIPPRGRGQREREQHYVLLREIQGHGKVAEHTGGKRGAEENLRWVRIHVADELEQIWVGGGLAEDGARLEDDLVRAEVFALEKRELVLVGEVQRALRICLYAEMQRLDTLRARIGPGVAGGEKLCSAEAGLAVEDRLVVDGHLNWNICPIKLCKS